MKNLKRFNESNTNIDDIKILSFVVSERGVERVIQNTFEPIIEEALLDNYQFNINSIKIISSGMVLEKGKKYYWEDASGRNRGCYITHFNNNRNKMSIDIRGVDGSMSSNFDIYELYNKIK